MPYVLQAVVGLAVGGFADRAIAGGVAVGQLRKALQTVPWRDKAGQRSMDLSEQR